MSEHEFCTAAKAEILRLLRIVQRLEGHLAYMQGRLSRAPLARRTVERDRARYLAQQLVDRLDYVSRVEMAEAIAAAMADEVES
jgi:hypothetical protein